jgi:hypothetical protein
VLWGCFFHGDVQIGRLDFAPEFRSRKQRPITTNFSHDSWRMILLSRKTSKAIIAGQINATSPGMPQRAYVSEAAT